LIIGPVGEQNIEEPVEKKTNASDIILIHWKRAITKRIIKEQTIGKTGSLKSKSWSRPRGVFL
jgi:hypothetical protein